MTNKNLSPRLLTPHYKGFPPAAEACPVDRIAERKWNILKGDLSFPIALLRDSAITHNLAWMMRFTEERGLKLAPHGKASMSPELYRRQLAAGAWGISFATVFQLLAGVEAGIERALIANQVICEADLDGLAAILKANPRLTVWFLIDSIAQIAIIEAWQAKRGLATRFNCLLEVGIAEKRTGCRNLAEALNVAERAHHSPALSLDGLECYEGSVAQCDTEHDRKEVNKLMDRVAKIASACDTKGYFDGEQILLTAGGSALFDLVAPGLKMALSKPVISILRSGCYITHDHGSYGRFLQKVEERIGVTESLKPAIEVWAMVQSTPEPGLSILTCGKRDISHDLALPIALYHYSQDTMQPRAIPDNWQLADLNDQHAYLRYPPQSKGPAVGDLIGLGISHPCTTFDKWTWMPVVDDNYTVCSAITTRF